jgi:hypothetical protein
MNEFFNIDPNFSKGRGAVYTVRLTFGLWEYRTKMEVDIIGNIKGIDVIDFAVERAFDLLPVNGSENDYICKYIILTDNKGDTLECNDEFEEDYWLKNMLVAAEIIDIKPYKNKEKRNNG